MATTSPLLNPGLGHVLVEFSYQYEGRDGLLVQIQPNERYELLSKTNSHWWQVRSGPGSKPFYIPAKYVRELPQVPALFPDPIGPENPPAPSPAHTPAPCPAPLPVPVPVLPKTHEDNRKPSDQVTIRLRPDGGHRKAENRMSTFGVPLDLDLTAAPKTTNGSGTTNMPDSVRVLVPGDPGKNPAPLRHQPIAVEIPRAPPTQDTVPKKGKEDVQPEEPMTKKGQQEVKLKGQPDVTSKGQPDVTSKGQPDVTSKGQLVVTSKGQLDVTSKGQLDVTSKGQPDVTSKGQPDVTSKGQQEVIKKGCEEEEERLEEEPSESEEEEERESSHIYESIQDLNLDLDALIGPVRTHKQEVASEAPPPPKESAPCPIYANVLKPIPPPPSEPAPAAPGPVHSFSGSSSSGLSPASPLSPLDGWESGDWERLVDEVSGRFYFFNHTTGATSWALPEPHTPSSISSSRPLLPEEDYPQAPHLDDCVFTSMLIPRVHLESTPDPPHRPSQLPQRMMGNGVSEEGAASSRVWRHSLAEDKLYPVRRNASDLTNSSKGNASDVLQGHLLEKAGIINKTKVCDNGKKIRKNWSQSWTVLHGGILTFHKDPKLAPTGTNSKASQIVPEFTVDLRGASVHWVNNKSSKKNVIELKTRHGCEFLMQYDTESIICDWYKVMSDTIRQLDPDHMSEDSDDSDKEDRKRISTRSTSGADSEQRRVRHKLRRFLQRRPTLQSVKEKGYIRDAVFGCHLDTLCHRENISVPRFVEKCIRFVERRGLDTDGIYRVSGNLAVIQRLRHKADHEEHLDLEDGQWTEIHVVTGALKLFFRELPEPLFPFSAYDKFIAAIQLSDYSQRVSYIKDLVQTLPLPNHSTMELLFRHLRRVVEHKEHNRMSVQSLAIVFGPTLLRPQTESNMTIHMVFQSQIVELILNEFSGIFNSK